jgi:hypothetical protein
MSCERFRHAITDHACGAPIDAQAAAHLAGCATCTRVFEDHQRVLAEADEELRTALAIVASPNFTARVSQRVLTAPRSASVPAWWWITATAAATMLAIGVIFTLSGHQDAQPVRSASAQPPAVSPAPPTVSAPATPTADRAPNRIAETKSVATPITHRRTEQDVIVPPDQRRAIARLTELLRNGTLDAKALPQEPKTMELTIAPLTVPDIVIPDVQSVGGSVARGAERE